MTVITMDCRAGMATLMADSVDAVVTDPPYGLSKQPDMRKVLTHWLNGDDFTATGGGFMGKSWDSFVPGPLTWAEAYRVLKPGGYLVAFAGSRTVDLMATSLRLGGFEVVDMLHWLYGSGFPKSMDISKAIDSHDAAVAKREKQYAFTKWFTAACPLPKNMINELLGVSDMARHYTDVPPAGKQPAIATQDHMDALAPFLTEPVPGWVRALVAERTEESENMKRRKIVGAHNSRAQAAEWRATYSGGGVAPPGNITEPHSEEALQWDGWGTALKPCHEPIILCRKPLDGTYANNVLTHGLGGLNIDGCRVGGDRWPGNVLHDGCLPEPMDRYFYCAKATKADREAGLADFDTASASECTGGRAEGSAGINNARAGAGRTKGGKNIHPTVKPTELMRWLCRLVTPPGGLILDPFVGSGSTGRGAALEGFGFLGFELSEGYAEIARARILDAEQQAKHNAPN